MAIDNLKDIWKNQKEYTITFSESDIVKMIYKSSTSIVKWIFIISIIEFIVIMVLPSLFLDSDSAIESKYGISLSIYATTIISVIVSVFFIIKFYLNYKQICVNDSTKKLMNSILQTRKTVSQYIATQLVINGLFLMYFFFLLTKSDDFINQLPNGEDTNMTMIWFILIGTGLFVLLLIWLFYKLLYGILLSKLKFNYAELERQ